MTSRDIPERKDYLKWTRGMMLLSRKRRLFLFVDWRRWTFGIECNRYMDDWKIYLPVVALGIWL